MTSKSESDTSSTAAETRAIHHGTWLNKTSSLSPPIFQSSTFRLESAAQGADFARGTAPTEFYTRWGNPTTQQAESVLANLEGAEAARVFSSGMGAISALFLSTVESGSHVVVGRSIYSGVSELVNGLLGRFGVLSTFVDARDLAAVEAALTPETRMIFVETPTNPMLEICDLEAIARLGKGRGVLTAVDSTFGTPINQRPLAFGIDVVVHSATKFLGGHSDLTAGVVCGSREVVERCWYLLKVVGASISPFEAWLLLRGVRTLALRVRQQNDTALELARFLEQRSEVERVHYPGLDSHPQHALANRQMDGFGGVLSFELSGGFDAAVRCMESLKLVELAVSLGGVESLVQHPASMTHGMLPAEDIRKAGISPGLLRVSVGLEAADDLKNDLGRALGDR
jgi:cystathionine beta-lyase/cystathionine gamma-synthase